MYFGIFILNIMYVYILYTILNLYYIKRVLCFWTTMREGKIIFKNRINSVNRWRMWRVFYLFSNSSAGALVTFWPSTLQTRKYIFFMNLRFLSHLMLCVKFVLSIGFSLSIINEPKFFAYKLKDHYFIGIVNIFFCFTYLVFNFL
jgi:hypothetical protein